MGPGKCRREGVKVPSLELGHLRGMMKAVMAFKTSSHWRRKVR